MIKKTIPNKKLVICLGLGLIAILFQSCYYDVEEDLYVNLDCNTDITTYNAIILPIIDFNCLGCHNAQDSQGGVTLEPYSELKIYADNGDLSCALNHNPGCSPMPKNAQKLSDCDILKIETWITNGAIEN